MRLRQWLGSVLLNFLQCFDTVALGDRKGILYVKKLVPLISRGFFENKYVGPPSYRATVYAGRILVSRHSEYADGKD